MRTIVTIIGIILSAEMICAVTTFASSMQNYALQGVIYNDGAWHGSETGTSYSTYENIAASDKVDSAIYFQQLGYAKLENCTNEYKPYLYLLGESENTETMMSVHVTSGSFPTASNEILLPEHLATNGGVSYKIGDTLTLELGDRMLDGWDMTQNNPNYVYIGGKEVLQDETLEVRETRTYTVVGFYERFDYRIENYDVHGYTALTIADEAVSGDYLYDVYFKMNNVRDIYELPVSCGITYLIYLAIMEGYETVFHLPWTGIIVAVLSVFAVVFAAMMYSMSKVKKDNPIDALKNENL